MKSCHEFMGYEFIFIIIRKYLARTCLPSIIMQNSTLKIWKKFTEHFEKNKKCPLKVLVIQTLELSAGESSYSY